MAEDRLRFLHAADLHLDQPPYGLNEIPAHWREFLLESPLRAATHVFDAAIRENAAFLIHVGDLAAIDESDPRILAFLEEQWLRLEAEGISFYWVGGRADPPGCWPSDMPLPPNVHVAHPREITVWALDAKPAPHTEILAWSEAASDSPPWRNAPGKRNARFTIAAHQGDFQPAHYKGIRLDYVALGGNHASAEHNHEGLSAHDPGTPQGRCPDEAGIHGCGLVTLSRDRPPQWSTITTDVLRWHDGEISAEESHTPDQWTARLLEKCHELHGLQADVPVFVRWYLTGDEAATAPLRERRVAEEIRMSVNRELTREKTPIWCTALEPDSTYRPPREWFEEDSISGEYLRTMRDRREELTRLSTVELAQDLGKNVSRPDEETLQQLADSASDWDDAMRLGVYRLRGGEKPT